MGITGRYSFTGIQRAASVGINALLATTGWGAWLLASPFRIVLDTVEGLAVNWLTNRGLIIFNVGDVLVNGVVNEEKLSATLDSAFDQMKVGRDKITPAQGAKIDAETDAAFDQFADVNATAGTDNSLPDLPGQAF